MSTDYYLCAPNLKRVLDLGRTGIGLTPLVEEWAPIKPNLVAAADPEHQPYLTSDHARVGYLPQILLRDEELVTQGLLEWGYTWAPARVLAWEHALAATDPDLFIVSDSGDEPLLWKLGGDAWRAADWPRMRPGWTLDTIYNDQQRYIEAGVALMPPWAP